MVAVEVACAVEVVAAVEVTGGSSKLSGAGTSGGGPGVEDTAAMGVVRLVGVEAPTVVGEGSAMQRLGQCSGWRLVIAVEGHQQLWEKILYQWRG